MSKQGKIVIIEDDLDDQDIVKEAFESLAIKNELQFFGSCDEAYNYLMSTHEKPFIILCDINMPRMNGIELKKKIDQTDYLRKKAIPFVFLTTSTEQHTIDEAYLINNLQGYFSKGHTMNEVKQKIKCIVEYWQTAEHPSM